MTKKFIFKCNKCGEDVERMIFRTYNVCYKCKNYHKNLTKQNLKSKAKDINRHIVDNVFNKVII